METKKSEAEELFKKWLSAREKWDAALRTESSLRTSYEVGLYHGLMDGYEAGLNAMGRYIAHGKMFEM
jgi:hypothetical protein